MENLLKFGATYRPVQCLHQQMVHMKRKQWGRRAKKCKAWAGAKGIPTGTGLQTAPSRTAPYRVVNGNLRKFRATYRPVQCLHQRQVHKKRKLCGRRAYICKPIGGAKSAPTGTGIQTAPSTAAPYRAVNGNLRKFGATYLPVQCLHQRKVHKKWKLWGRRA